MRVNGFNMRMRQENEAVAWSGWFPNDVFFSMTVRNPDQFHRTFWCMFLGGNEFVTARADTAVEAVQSVMNQVRTTDNDIVVAMEMVRDRV